MCIKHRYISLAGEEGVKRFQYKGGSDSILYTYLWSPLCNYIVANWIPKWMAPNLVTTIGFLIHIVVHLLVMYHSPNLQDELPSWLCFLMAFSLLTYQILDNCDGKQARATNSSSPLGMLFDHGCDALATWMLALNTLAIFQIESFRLQFYTVLFIGLVPFYFAMWSQYNVGTFRLGYINAVDEGLVVGELIYLISGIFGQQIWGMQIEFLGITYGETALYCSMGMAVMQIIQFTNDLHSQVESDQFREGLKTQMCTLTLISTFVLVDLCLGIENILNCFIPFFYAMSFAWSNIIAHIQVAHITQEKFNQWQYSFLFSSFSFIFTSIYFYFTGTFIIDIIPFIYINLAVAFAVYVHFISCVFNQLADILGIFIFRLGKNSSYIDLKSLHSQSTAQELSI